MKIPHRLSRVCFWTSGILLALILYGFAQTGIPPAPPQQLSTGQKSGTFAFSYSGQVRFTQEPAFPVTVAITDLVRHSFAQIEVKDGSSFTISADLLPGSYEITSRVQSEKSQVYWDALGQRFFIDPKGVVTPASRNGLFIHQKKMTVLSPDPKGTETVTELQPLLKWQPLEGATHYNVSWFVEESGGKIDHDKNGTSGEIATTEYRLPEEVIPCRRYEWSVMASGPDHQPLGYWSAAYFFTPGGKEAFKKDSPPVSVKSGASYLGIAPTPRPMHPGLSSTGIGVMGVFPDSPALKAGLLPEDILTDFNGHSLENISVLEFVHLVQEVPVGKQVMIEFLRQGVKKSAQATIEAKP